MTKKFFNLRSVVAIAITLAGVTFASYSVGEDKQQQSATMKQAQEVTDRAVQRAATKNDFTAAGKAKIDSLGKSEKGKRLVVRFDAMWGAEITVSTWEEVDGEAYFRQNKYTFYYSSRKASYDSSVKSMGASEKSDDGLWLLKEGAYAKMSWQEYYDRMKKNSDYKVIE